MNYFDDPQNVEEYIRMAEGYDGQEFVPILCKYLKDGADVLELGMGPGKDLDLLSAHFRVTGSDSSRVFIERYRKTHPEADLLLLDAVTMDLHRTFDGIYSNKVLSHLTEKDLAVSLQRQARALNRGGILFHTFWYGDGEEIYSGLRTVYYTQASFYQIAERELRIIEWERYTEIEEGDSFYAVLARGVV